MNRQQSGFTLIELIVVIVLLGILAAAAIPRFTGLTDQARQAVGEGVVGAILSSAVIQYGVNRGDSSTFEAIVTAAEVQPGSNNSIEYSVTDASSGFQAALAGLTCADGVDSPHSFWVSVASATGDHPDQVATGTIPAGLCSG